MGERPHFTHQHDAYRPETIMMGRAQDDQYKRFHFDLCRAIDMTSVSVVLSKMVEAGAMDKRMAELFHLQASSLLALMLSDNNRAFTQARHD